MTEPTTALTKQDPTAIEIRKKMEGMAQSTEPPMGIPIPREDWGAMALEDRVEALTLYHKEVNLSFEGMTPEFPKIKMPTGGTQFWQMPDGRPEKSFKGVILGQFPARAFWKSRDITNSPPDCSSIDMRTPVAGEGPDIKDGNKFFRPRKCSECPYSQFGSAVNEDGTPGGGKACKEVINVFVKMDGPIPYHLPLPPTSIRPFTRYVTALVNDKEMKSLTSVETEFGLDLKQGKRAAYSIIKPTYTGRRLTWKEMREAITLREEFMEQMRRRGIDEEVVKGDGDAPDTHAEEVQRQPGEEDGVPF